MISWGQNLSAGLRIYCCIREFSYKHDFDGYGNDAGLLKPTSGEAASFANCRESIVRAFIQSRSVPDTVYASSVLKRGEHSIYLRDLSKYAFVSVLAKA